MSEHADAGQHRAIDLEKRIAALEDIEAIKRLKARYWRSMDRKQWDDLARCFVHDATAEYPRRGISEGRAAIVDRIRKSTEALVTMHHGHNPDIELTSATTARGVWAMQDRLYDPATQTMRTGYGFYEDEFVKVDGEWKISALKLIRLFPERMTGEM